LTKLKLLMLSRELLEIAIS